PSTASLAVGFAFLKCSSAASRSEQSRFHFLSVSLPSIHTASAATRNGRILTSARKPLLPGFLEVQSSSRLGLHNRALLKPERSRSLISRLRFRINADH